LHKNGESGRGNRVFPTRQGSLSIRRDKSREKGGKERNLQWTLVQLFFTSKYLNNTNKREVVKKANWWIEEKRKKEGSGIPEKEEGKAQGLRKTLNETLKGGPRCEKPAAKER